MGLLAIKIHPDFNIDSVAEEIQHHLQEEQYDMRAIDITTTDDGVQIKSDIIHFDKAFLNVITDASDGYRTGIDIT